LDQRARRRFQDANELRAAVQAATGHFQNLPGDMPRSNGRRKWRWLPRFALAAGTIWLAVVTYILLREHWVEEKSVLIPAGALEAFAAGPEGAGIGRRMVAELKLSKEQVQTVNKIVRLYQREFTALERRHTAHSKNAAGHMIMTIPPFPQEMDELMGRMWTDLGPVLSPGQLAQAKTMRFERFFPHTGKKPVTAEFWQEDNGEYHYLEGAEPAGKNGRSADRQPSRDGGLLLPDSSKTNN